MDLKTVHRLQQVAAQRAETHHRQVVRGVDVPGVQLDEAHSKLRPHQVAWIHTALAMGSWFLLWVDVGPRTQEQAALMLAQVVARVRELPLFLTDGWKAYSAALLQVLGMVYGRRRRGKVGRKPKPRLVAPKHLFLCPGCQGPQPAGTGGGGQQARRVWRSSPLYAAIASAAARHDDPDRVYGTVVWHPARPGGAAAPPYPVSVLELGPPPRTAVAHGQSLQLCDAP